MKLFDWFTQWRRKRTCRIDGHLPGGKVYDEGANRFRVCPFCKESVPVKRRKPKQSGINRTKVTADEMDRPIVIK